MKTEAVIINCNRLESCEYVNADVRFDNIITILKVPINTHDAKCVRKIHMLLY